MTQKKDPATIEASKDFIPSYLLEEDTCQKLVVDSETQ